MDLEASIAVAKPGVLVNAPVNKPTINRISVPENLPNKRVIKPPLNTTTAARAINCIPCSLNDLKNPGPAAIPTEYINSINPMFCNSSGVLYP